MDPQPTDPVTWLLDRGAVTPAQVEDCRAACAVPDDPRAVLSLLVERGYVDPVELAALGPLPPPVAPQEPPTGTMVPEEEEGTYVAEGPRACTAVVPGTAGSPRPGAPTAAELAPPKPPPGLPAFRDFVVYTELGRGGMGIVYRAWDKRLSRVVALKVVEGAMDDRDPRKMRFLREARAAARLKHPRIVQVHEVGEADGRLFLSMDYIAGTTLRKRMEDPAFDPREGARLLKQVAEGLSHAHEQGVVHRDIKPENVLIDGAGRANVVDFGLAVELGDTTRMTASGAVLGTPWYMAPEQAEGDVAAIGPRSDVYAVGAVLYEVLTGRPPFQGPGALETIYQVIHTDVVAPSAIRRDVPRELEVICLQCLEKDAARRYPTAAALAEDLGRFLDGEPVRARTATASERLRRWLKKRRWAVAAAVLVAVAATVAARMARLAQEAAQSRERSTEESTLLRDAQVAIAEAIGRQRTGDATLYWKVLHETLARAEERIRADPQAAAPWLLKGWMKRLLAEPRAAEEALTAALARAPDNALAHYQLGIARLELRRRALEEARQRRAAAAGETSEALPASTAELVAASPEVHALERGAEEELLAASRLIEQGQGGELSRGMATCGLGLLASARGNTDDAKRLFRKALEEDPFLDDAWDGLIDCLSSGRTHDAGSLAELLRTIDEALEANRGRFALWVTRARVRGYVAATLEGQGDLDEARRLLQEGEEDVAHARRIRPDLPDSWIVEADLRKTEAMVMRGRDARDALERGIAAAGEVISQIPISPEGHWRRGELRRLLAVARGEAGEDAEEDLRAALCDEDEAIRLDPGQGESWLGRGFTWLRLGEARRRRGKNDEAAFRSAIADFERAARLGAGARAIEYRGLAKMRLGERLLDSGSPGDAETTLRESLADLDEASREGPQGIVSDVNRLACHLALGRLLLDTARDPGECARSAMEAARRALDMNAESAEAFDGIALAHYLRARWLLRQGGDPEEDLARAIEALDRAVRADPSVASHRIHRALMRTELARSLAARGSDPRDLLRTATEDCQEARRVNPADALLLLQEGNAWKEMAEGEVSHGGDPRKAWGEAIEAFDAALSRNPALGEAWRDRGWTRLRQAETGGAADEVEAYRAAIRDEDEALSRNPRDATALLGRGRARKDLARALEARGQAARDESRRAIADLDAALRIEPDQAQAYHQRGSARSILAEAASRRREDPREELARALRDLDQAVALDPKRFAAVVDRGVAWQQMALARRIHGGDAAEALAHALADMDRAIELSPGSFEAITNRGTVFKDIGDVRRGRQVSPAEAYARALADFDRALELRLSGWQALANRGMVFESLGRLEEAERDLDAALRIAGDACAPVRESLDRVRAERTAEPWVVSLLEAGAKLDAGDSASARSAYEDALAAADRALAAVSEERRRHCLGLSAVRSVLMNGHYNLACCLCREAASAADARPLLDRALAELRRAIELGYADWEHLERDPDLAALRLDPRWQELRRH